MCQLHRRLSAAQVKFPLQADCQGTVTRTEVREILGIGKTRFFALLRQYHQDPQGSSLTYRWSSPAKLSWAIENEITRQLVRENKLVENPHIPISDNNYSALRDRLAKRGMSVSGIAPLRWTGKGFRNSTSTSMDQGAAPGVIRTVHLARRQCASGAATPYTLGQRKGAPGLE